MEVEGSFTTSAWILGGRWRHHRQRDHFGSDLDTFVVLTAPVGGFVEGTPIHYVLADLVERILALESNTRKTGSITANAYIWPYYLFADAVIYAVRSGSFTMDARFQRGGVFAVDAVIRGQRSFIVDAVIV